MWTTKSNFGLQRWASSPKWRGTPNWCLFRANHCHGFSPFLYESRWRYINRLGTMLHSLFHKLLSLYTRRQCDAAQRRGGCRWQTKSGVTSK